MEYKLGETIWKEILEKSEHYLSREVKGVLVSEGELIKMGAIPCGKCGEREQAEKDFGDKSKLRFDYQDQPKEEKIEVQLPQKPAYIGGGNDWSTRMSIEYVGDCILYLANKLNKGDN